MAYMNAPGKPLHGCLLMILAKPWLSAHCLAYFQQTEPKCCKDQIYDYQVKPMIKYAFKIIKDLRYFNIEVDADIHVQYTRTESGRLGYATVRLTGSPIARDLEKYTEVFTEGVKCWRIDSIGHGRTRTDTTRLSLCRFD